MRTKARAASWASLLVLGLSLAGQLTPPAAAVPKNFGLHGADTAGEGRHLMGLDAGLPSLGFTYLYGADRHLDVGLRASFYYIFPYYDVFFSLGSELAFVLRYRFVRQGAFSLTFQGELGALVDYDEGVGWGLLAVHPGLLFGVDLAQVHLFVGVSLPVTLLLGNNYTSALVPIAFHLGTEIRLARNLNLALRVRVGPSIAITETRLTTGTTHSTTVSFIANATLGVQFRF